MIRSFGFSALLLLLFACSQEPYKVQLDEISYSLPSTNLDSIIRHSQKKQLHLYLSQLKKADRSAAEFCFPYALQIPLQPDSSFQKALHNNLQNPFNRSVFNALELKSKWRKEVQTSVESAFKRLAALAPKLKKPSQLYFAYTQFAASAYCSDKSIVIGQERYLGPKHPIISHLPEQQFYQWIKEGLAPQYATSDAVLGWLSTHFIKETDENFASEMIRWGKLLVILDILLPEESLANKLRYTQADLEWALASETKFWEYLVEQQMLFKTDQELNMNLLNEGPYSIGLPQQSPDRMGRFLGYQIVRQYVNAQHPSLNALIHIPYNQILQKYEVPK